MLLLTGATGSIGSRLLPLLLEADEQVRCLVREPRRLGERRVDVQIALGDLGEMSDPYLVRQALRGVDTVIHLAATIRDAARGIVATTPQELPVMQAPPDAVVAQAAVSGTALPVVQ